MSGSVRRFRLWSWPTGDLATYLALTSAIIVCVGFILNLVSPALLAGGTAAGATARYAAFGGYSVASSPWRVKVALLTAYVCAAGAGDVLMTLLINFAAAR